MRTECDTVHMVIAENTADHDNNIVREKISWEKNVFSRFSLRILICFDLLNLIFIILEEKVVTTESDHDKLLIGDAGKRSTFRSDIKT